MNTDTKRKIFLDTETTGMNKLGKPYEGHQIIEIGAVEMINRHLTNENFHVYIKPKRSIDPESFNIHGISDEFLFDKPSFSDISNEFLEFIKNSELIIHNAPFDVSFINYELSILNFNLKKIESICTITDSLQIARKQFPGKRNNIDALCDRYYIDRTSRFLHSALLDAKILAKIYLMMTGGQTTIFFTKEINSEKLKKDTLVVSNNKITNHFKLKIIYANKEEKLAHEKKLNSIKQKHGICLWLK